MDIYQFYNSASRLALAIQSSGLMGAVKNCRACLAAGSSSETNTRLAEAMLLRASTDYIEHAERFDADGKRIAEHFHLHSLSSPDYWTSLTDESSSASSRLGEMVSLYSRLMFASSHLPRLLSLIGESGAGVSDGKNAPPMGSFVLELSDLRLKGVGEDEEVESAADPDRIARVIDGANMVYQGAALLAGGRQESLRLASITGSESRTLVFQGQQEAATAVRRIIRHLTTDSVTSGNSISEAGDNPGTNAEHLVEQLPFLTSLTELERIGALSSELIGDIRSSIIAGSIMLVEAGVVIADGDRGWSSHEIALPITGTAPSVVETEVEAHYLDHFEAVRERMLGEVNESAGEQRNDEPAQADQDQAPDNMQSQQKLPGISDEPDDDLDDLIVDLNRLYKR